MTSKQTFLGPGDSIGEGDTYVLYDFLPPELADTALENLLKEVQWNKMSHRGGEVPRLVAVEGTLLEDGSQPLYRHPADESPPLLPFSPTVERIRRHVAKILNEPVNHALIQHYRNGSDYISEHSDKTVDVARGSKIVNVSLGAQRIMTLRTKKDALANSNADLDTSNSDAPKRRVQRVPLPHNSIFVMGLRTNARWQHGIARAPEREKFGERISLTFRTIGTYLTRDERHIFGQGAKGKTREEARPVVRGGEESEKLIIAFGAENHQSDFDWDAHYGQGFDVLHFQSAQPIE
ncbi:uncharacterized protein TRAVEDRAFT_174644 [Trametes versicolor FP-101664 SS1]|uniref:uncharacterized protein n=1 Tax=Trametes versicolor (strain FP-101664) TaxID=717944 RepID=UPI0004622D76|nr:uncharacterized protein TRAVEDRAFT_174644 [Trametes versicolor FP-101664 SS1]EIW52558.1 hypothetical protein TRAVEDRAFT_174644 [Trametes versicolor FP-101664 SS1]